MDNFIVQLIARLDASKTPDDLKKIEQQLNNKGVKIKPVIDLASSKQEIQNLAVQMQKVLSDIGINIDTSKITSSINKVVQDMQSVSAKAGKIGINIDTGTYAAKVDSIVAKTQKWTDVNGNARISTTNLQSALSNLNTAYANITATGGNTEANQRALIEAEKQLGIQIQDVTSKVTTMNAKFATDQSVQSLLHKYQDFYTKNTAAHRKWGAELKAGIAELSSGMPVSLQRAQQLEQGIYRIGNAARQAGKLGLSGFDKLKQGMQKFSYWTSSTFMVMKAVQEVREAVSFAKELDSALANINYTMGVTQSELTNIGNSSIQMAKDLKTSASDVLGAVTLYANAKETADSILKKSETAIMLGNVTGMSGQESAKALQSVMNQFDLTQDDLTYISDTIQKVSQNMAYDFAAGVEEIVGGIERSGSVAKAAGLDLEEYASMLGLVIEKTGLSGDTIGTAYRTNYCPCV